MSAFSMCPSCRKEYITVSDRRFHAEPVACNHCGPSYYALYNKVKVTDYSELLNLSSRLLREGEVIAAKGIGGYHLICDARSEKAVSRLRDIKQRDGMPFAFLASPDRSVEATPAVGFVRQSGNGDIRMYASLYAAPFRLV